MSGTVMVGVADGEQRETYSDRCFHSLVRMEKRLAKYTMVSWLDTYSSILG